MIQCLFHQMYCAVADIHIVVVTVQNQYSLIRWQLGNEVNISIEPCRRDTFSVIAFVSAYLHEEYGIPLYRRMPKGFL